ncbi:MAG: hypothetical protein NVS4B3_19900 [Gemmatimonadaceae bacterium]
MLLRHARVTVTVFVVSVTIAACPGDKKPHAGRGADTIAVVAPDTAAPPGDLSGVKTTIPSASPDTFRARKVTNSGAAARSGYPPPPAPLVDAVEREAAVSRFCYQEFGQKSDPSLTGGVAMQVTIGATGVTDARVAQRNWSSAAGRAVDRCLTERVVRAWKVNPGAVPPGKYYVPLTFRGS